MTGNLELSRDVWHITIAEAFFGRREERKEREDREEEQGEGEENNMDAKETSLEGTAKEKGVVIFGHVKHNRSKVSRCAEFCQ